jgi:serine/threonine protein kinase
VEFLEISEYKVLRQLGAGGMGQVFLVQHPRLPRQVAMKLLDAGVSRNDEFKTRFRREADLLAQLSHPSIVTLFDRGEFEGRLWITMEFIDGTDAAALAKARGPLPVPLALTLVDGAGAALDHAWRKQRITHRDVKPANILVALAHDLDTKVEAVKLADFGIAKAVGETTSLTSTGITVGTVSYISPEAFEGRDIDNRADIYSLGCTAFQLLTGAPPFSGNSITALMSAHLTHPVPEVTDRVPELPRSLNAVFAKALAKQPEDRYQSCAELVADLRATRDADRPTHFPTVIAAAAPTQAAPTMVRPADAVTDGNHSGLSLRPVSRRISVGVLAAIIVATALVGALIVWRSGIHQVASPRPPTPSSPTGQTSVSSLIVPGPPAPPPLPPPSLPTPTPSTTTATTTSPPVAQGLACGQDNDDKLAEDAETGDELLCSPNGIWPPKPSDWKWWPAPALSGVHVGGSSCMGAPPYQMSKSTDSHLIWCEPDSPSGTGPGSVWKLYSP